jgi:hypothetical protein
MNATKSLLRIAPLASVLGALLLGASPVAAADSNYHATWMVSRDSTQFFIDTPAPADRWNSTGSSASDDVQRLGIGHYRASFAGYLTLDGASAVTAIGGSNWCTVPGWTFASREDIEISCYASNGQMVDSAFSVNFLYRSGPSGGPALGYARNYTPAADHDVSDRAYNSSGKAIHAVRTSKGHTTVTFVGLARASGNVQVTRFQDATAGTCTTSKWAVVGADEQINVVCRDSLGAFADLQYDVFFLDKVSLRGAASGAGAYFVASLPSAAAYQPGAARRWSSSGQSPWVNRLSVGRYQVTLTGIAGKGGSVQVTAATGTSNRCNIASIPTSGTVQRVTVRCSKLNGSPADTPFSFLFTR